MYRHRSPHTPKPIEAPRAIVRRPRGFACYTEWLPTVTISQTTALTATAIRSFSSASWRHATYLFSVIVDATDPILSDGTYPAAIPLMPVRAVSWFTNFHMFLDWFTGKFLDWFTGGMGWAQARCGR